MASEDSDATHRAQPPPPPAINPAGLPNGALLPLQLRLDRNNYSYWRALVLAATRAYGLDGYILGSNIPPPSLLPGNRPNPAYQQWIRFDQFLMHWLMNSISEVMLGHIIHCRSSFQIWTDLDKRIRKY